MPPGRRPPVSTTGPGWNSERPVSDFGDPTPRFRSLKSVGDKLIRELTLHTSDGVVRRLLEVEVTAVTTNPFFPEPVTLTTVPLREAFIDQRPAAKRAAEPVDGNDGRLGESQRSPNPRAPVWRNIPVNSRAQWKRLTLKVNR